MIFDLPDGRVAYIEVSALNPRFSVVRIEVPGSSRQQWLAGGGYEACWENEYTYANGETALDSLLASFPDAVERGAPPPRRGKGIHVPMW